MSPSPFRSKVCEWCGAEWSTQSAKARTCSPICRARLRETEKPTAGRPKRDYPQDIVDAVCNMYMSGMTVAEINEVAPAGYKVQTILQRYLSERRPQAKRNQTGEQNSSWRGSNASYTAVHLRLKVLSGPASDHECVDCGKVADDWSYQNQCEEERRELNRGKYCTHVEHYRPRCRPCHHAFDREEVVSHV